MDVVEDKLSRLHSPEVMKFIEQITSELVLNYGKILASKPEIKVNAATLCDINISIVSSFMENILKILNDQFKDLFGEEISPKKVFESISLALNERLAKVPA